MEGLDKSMEQLIAERQAAKKANVPAKKAQKKLQPKGPKVVRARAGPSPPFFPRACPSSNYGVSEQPQPRSPLNRRTRRRQRRARRG